MRCLQAARLAPVVSTPHSAKNLALSGWGSRPRAAGIRRHQSQCHRRQSPPPTLPTGFFVAQDIQVAQYLGWSTPSISGTRGTMRWRAPPAGSLRHQVLRRHCAAQHQLDAGQPDLLAEIAQRFRKTLPPGTCLATLNWPPISDAASNSVTSSPRRAASVAKRQAPQGLRPPRRRALSGEWLHHQNGFVAGARIHQAGGDLAGKVWSRQAWLQPMQVLIWSDRPAAALLTNSGSARNGRAILTMSAMPSCRICSATSGVLMRLVATSGMPTLP